MRPSAATPEGDGTELLGRLGQGDSAALDELVPLLYGELRRIARENLRRERAAHTLVTTALVNEAYLRLVQNRRISVRDRSQFFGAASLTMRRILADYARARKRVKRGAGVEPVALDEADQLLTAPEADEILALDDALDRLAELDERAARVVQLRFFGGLEMQEIAAVLGVSERTVRRDWLSSRAWLRHEVASDLGLALTDSTAEEREGR
ncbi:MAG: ECF-type sigma factor [Holophagales bacterium]|nr:ECF-type sigma factor [Holophagales bacterium]